MMPKKNLLRFCAIAFMTLCINKNLFAQTNFQPGYVLALNKDTLHGFIDFRKWDNNPDKILFRSSEKAEALQYLPYEILEFKVQDEIYVGAIVQVETSPRQTSQLEEDPALHFKTDTAFLQVIHRGNKGLYYFKTQDSKQNFYTLQNGQFELLIHKSYLHPQDGKLYTRENKQYMNQLVLYLNDCSTLQSKIYKARYELNSLQNIFNAYDACTNTSASFQKKTEKVKLETGVLAGVSLTSLNFKGQNFAYLSNTDYKLSTNVTAGLFFDIVFPRWQRKWSINNELMYSAYKFTGSYQEITNSEQYRVYDTEIAYTHIKLNNMLRYKFSVGKMFVFANAGISTGFVLKETNEKTITATFYDNETVTHEPAVAGTRNIEGGMLFGIGAKYQKFSLESRYEFANGMSEVTGLKSGVTRLQFLFGYRF